MISVIFGRQLSLRVDCCTRDEVYFTTLLWQISGLQNGFISRMLFSELYKIMVDKVTFLGFRGVITSIAPLDPPLIRGLWKQVVASSMLVVMRWRWTIHEIRVVSTSWTCLQTWSWEITAWWSETQPYFTISVQLGLFCSFNKCPWQLVIWQTNNCYRHHSKNILKILTLSSFEKYVLSKRTKMVWTIAVQHVVLIFTYMWLCRFDFNELRSTSVSLVKV